MKTEKKYVKWEDRKAKPPVIPAKLTTRLGEPIKTINVNSNNAWGFGGWHGTSTEFNGEFYYEVGTISTRHQGTFPKKVVKTGACLRFSVDDFCKAWD